MSVNYCHSIYKIVKNSFKKKSFQVNQVRFVPEGAENPLTSAEVQDIFRANGGMFKKIKAQKRLGVKKPVMWKLVYPLFYGAYIEKKNMSDEDVFTYIYYKHNNMVCDPTDEQVAGFKSEPGYVYFMRINREDYPKKNFKGIGTDRPADRDEWILHETEAVSSDVVVGEFFGVF